MKNTKFHAYGVTSLKSALCLGVGLTAIMSVAAPAYAQDEGEEDARTLQTVTITATKREQTLQDVPVAVSVVDESVIEKAEIIDLGDLQSLVPSLRVGQQQSSANTNFYIRGFGNGANNAGIEPSVGVFIDGVYRSRSASQISDLPNIERVEVLRGPQSTLFGKNASAGVISVVTQKPQFDFGGNVEGTVSNFNGYRLGGYVTGPISDKLAYSFGANYNKRDGYVEDLGFGPDTNERNRWGVRGDILFEPTDNASFRLIMDYDEIDEICCAAANIINGPTGAVVNALGGDIVAEDPFSYKVAYSFGSENQIENGGVSLQGDFDFDGVTLTSITAFRTSDLDTNQDSDFTSADLLSRNSNTTAIETFTQEVRLTSTNPGFVDWMVGAYYFDETVEIENAITYGADFRGYVDVLSSGGLAQVESLLNLPVGGAFGQSGQGFFEEFGQDNTAFSLFGSWDTHLTDRLTATLGLNYTKDEKDAYGRINSTDAFSGLDLVAIGASVVEFGAIAQQLSIDPNDPTAQQQIAAFAGSNPLLFSQIQAGANAFALANAENPAVNPLLALEPLQFFPPFLGFPNAVEDGHTNDEDVTYSLRLAYDFSDNINAYVSYSTGFKATSWNLSRDSRPFPADFIPGSPVTNPPGSPIRNAGLALPNLTTGTRYAGPEEAKVYEIGVKGAYSNFAFNLALFDQRIEGFQSNIFTGTGFALANAGEQSTQGMEFDAQWNVTDQLLLTFAGTFLDPLYDSFPNSSSGNLTGRVPSGIPETATSTSATYTFDVKNMDAFVRADWQYESPSAYFDSPADQALVGIEKEISTFNASAGFTTESGIGVTVWGRNIFDDEYITTAFPAVAQAGSVSGYPNQPATYGVTVRKSF